MVNDQLIFKLLNPLNVELENIMDQLSNYNKVAPIFCQVDSQNNWIEPSVAYGMIGDDTA
jgi:hypothetical protein